MWIVDAASFGGSVGGGVAAGTTRFGEQALAAGVTSGNLAPIFPYPIMSFAENDTATIPIIVLDPDTPYTELSFSITGGADAAKFVLTRDNNLAFVAAPDFEAPTDADGNNSYLVKVRVSDGALATEALLTINVTNVLEAPVITSNGGGNTATISIPENTTAVTTVTATDQDAGTNLVYSISGGANAGSFDINQTTGALSLKRVPDFESADRRFEVVVRASDGTLFDEQQLTVNITNVNEPPFVLVPSSIAVAENDTFVSLIRAFDIDGDNISVSIIGPDAARFMIRGSNLYFVAAPDFEAPTDADGNNSYLVKVRVSDGVLATEAPVTINVTNVNELTPVITSNGGGATAAISIAETGATVTKVTATGAEAGTPIVYSISGGADAAKFIIDVNSGALAFATAPNFEAPTDAGLDNVYDVTVRATGGTLFDDQTLAVTVTNVDEAPVLANPIATQSGLEDRAVSFTIPANAFVDPDGDTLGYSATLANEDALPGWLAFNAATRTFSGTPPANFNGRVDLKVTASANGKSASDVFTLDIAPFNDAPSALSLSNNSLFENSPVGTLVGTLTGFDVDGGTLRYGLVSNPGGRFAIEATTGNITVAAGAVIDFETAASHSIAAEVIDPDGLSFVRSFTLTVINVDEAPVLANPIATQSGLEDRAVSFTIPANAFVDPDGDTLGYSATLANENALPGWLAFNAATRTFSGTPPANFNGRIDLKVTASANGKSASDVFTLDIAPFNDAPSALSLSNNSLFENSPAGTLVGTLTGFDVDGGTLRYGLVSNPGGRFAIDATTGNITLAAGAVIDFETAASHSIAAEVIDPDGLSFVRSFTIAVTNVDEAPAVATSIPDRQSAEDELWVYTVPAGSFTDPDGDTLTYSARLANDTALPAWLSFNAATRTFSGFPPLNFNGTIDLKVTAAANGKAVSDVFTLAVTPVNDAPIDVTLSNASVAENSVAGTLVGTLKGEDVDNSTGLTYALTDTAGGRFTVDANSGNITVAPGVVLDFEAASSHNITARVTDPGGLSFSRSFSIAVGNVDEAPVLVRPLSPDFAINGGEQWNYSLADGYFVDPEGDALSYNVRPASGGDFLPNWAYFNEINGVLYVNPPLDLGGVFNFIVTATANGKSASGIFSLGVYAAAPPQRYVGTTAGDVFTADNTGVRWSVDGRGGSDRLTTGDSNDTIIGGTGNDTINAGGGDDVIIVNTAGTSSGFDQIDGGAGFDEIRAMVDNAVIGLTSLANIEAITGNGYSGVVVSGGSGNDRLDFSGTTLNEIGRIKGGAGNDTIIGSAYDDVIDGEAGNDLLVGGGGYNSFLVRGNVSGDRFDGTDGYDVLLATASNTTIAFSSLTSIEAINGNGYANVRLVGTTAADVINLAGMSIAGTIIDGGAGNDSIIGTDHDDIMVGGAGVDTLAGGAGADLFVYGSTREGGDRINGFEVGIDLIDLSAIDANTLLAGNQAFTFIGDSPFSRTPGELRVVRTVPNFVQVYADTNGDGRSDFYLLLQTDVNVTESDFLL